MTSQIFLDRRGIGRLLAVAAIFLAATAHARACQTPDDGEFVAAAARDSDPGVEPAVCGPPGPPMVTRPAILLDKTWRPRTIRPPQ